MVTENQKAVTTVVMLAAVLLLTFVPFSHTIPIVFADKQALLNDFSHATTSFAFASHNQGLFTGFSHATSSSSPANFHDTTTQGQGWYQHPDEQQYNKNWHHHGSHGDHPTISIKNNQNADCSSTSNANGGTANGGNGGNGPGGNGGASNGGNGGQTAGGNGGPSNGGNGGDLPGGTGGSGGSGSAGSQTACSNTSTFNVSNPA
jgi:hypothetical protein